MGHHCMFTSLAPRRMRGGSPAVAAFMSSLILAACATEGVPVTGKDPKGADAAYGQSETSISTGFANGKYIVTVTYNDETNPGNAILYTSTTRTIKSGAESNGLVLLA